MGSRAKIPPVAPAVIGTRDYKGVIRTDFAAKSIVSRQLKWSGACAAAHDIDAIEGASITKIKNLQLHFSWNMGYVGGIARAGGKLMHYRNRPRYLYVVSSPLEVEFEMERSSFKELAIELDQTFLLRSCEAVDPASTEIPDTWDYNDPLCWELANALHRECMAEAPNGSIYGETVMTLLALHTMKELAPRDQSPRFYTRGGLPPTVLRRAREYMMHHLSADVSLEEMGAVTGLSPGHFAYAFKRSMGIAPHAWLRRRRIEKAKELLRDRSLDIETIASSVGYSNQSAFGVAFKNETGHSPAAWRRGL